MVPILRALVTLILLLSGVNMICRWVTVRYIFSSVHKWYISHFFLFLSFISCLGEFYDFSRQSDNSSLFLTENFSPGRDRSPGGSLSVLVKLLCSLLQSCKMSPPECILSSGSISKDSNSVTHHSKHIIDCRLRAKWENSPSSGDRDSATSSVAVACKKKEEDLVKAFVCSMNTLNVRWCGGLRLWELGCWTAVCEAEHPTSLTASPHPPPGWERMET